MGESWRKDEAIKVLGGPTRLADVRYNARRSYKWKKYPPIDKQFQIMVLSGGRLAVTEDNTKETKTDE